MNDNYRCDDWAGKLGCPQPQELLMVVRKNGQTFYRKVCQEHAEQLRAQAKAGEFEIMKEYYFGMRL